MDVKLSDHRARRAAQRAMSRRLLIQGSSLALAAAVAVGARPSIARRVGLQGAGSEIPVSGEDVPALAECDAAMRDVVATWGLPGAQLAVGYGGRLVFDRGYGVADTETAEEVRPDHRFRIASVSKTITAVGIMRLIEAGQLALSDQVFPLLDLEPPPGATLDPRLDQVTVEHLLTHGGGWNADASGDPQYLPLSQLAAAALGESGPAQAETIIRFMLGWGLDHDPGTVSIYSNFGFNVAGRVIERVSGLPYERFIQQEVLAPAGIVDMELGRTRIEDRAEREVRYEQPPEYPATVPSVFPGEGFVPFAYGSFSMEGMDAHGGWIGRAADLARYALAIDGQRGEPLLTSDTVELMLGASRPPGEGLNGAANTDPATGLGWVVQPGPLGQEWAHTGALGGSTAALLLRNDDGLVVSFIANTLPASFVDFFADLRAALVGAVRAVETWPDHDLFEPGE